ncbi:hypothetical protein [Secundilactobacillus kimchicus]|uniref:hypothetical protein n=1 Tax=Secundilactobacillus kimchicus TaxID=528209 RepID=UPI0024A7D5F0|nr:hypothetical protein [Secundilactobacillus kimchicus]
MIRKLLFFTGLFVLLGGGIQGHADTSDKTQETGTVTYALTANYLKSDMSSNTINEIHDIAATDQNVSVVDDGLALHITEKMPTPASAKIAIGNDVSSVKSDGTFKVSANNLQPGKKVMASVKSDDGLLMTKQVPVDSQSQSITKVVNFEDFIENMDDMNSTNSVGTILRSSSAKYPGQKDGQKVSAGTHVHCNRFNGIHSNHRYYGRLNGQGWVNYYHSDCWYENSKYGCPFLKADTKCQGLLKHNAHNCSLAGNFHVRCWYRN